MEPDNKNEIESTPATPAARESEDASPRRAFLKGCGSVAALLALGAAAKALHHEQYLRPPGGQNEADFLAKCIKCDRCRSACHTSAIGVVSAGESFFNARTPVMKFHIGHCDFCNKCIEACPTQALRPFDKATVRIGVAQVNERCIAYSIGGCNVCKLACDYGAITFDEQKRPVVNADKCNGCGRCEKVCPALVLRSYLGGTQRGIEIRPIAELRPSSQRGQR